MQEDINDSDGDGITNELVEASSDHNIVKIKVQVAEYRKNTDDKDLAWASAIGYKGIQTKTPAIDLVIDDISDNNIDLSASGATMLGIDYRKNADMKNGLNNLDNFSYYDNDGKDNDNDNVTDYDGGSSTSTEGDILEADSDHIDNDNDGVVDEAFEQDDNSTKYSIEVYSGEPFVIKPDSSINVASGDVGVWIKGPNDSSFTEETSNFIDLSTNDSLAKTLGYEGASSIPPNTIYAYSQSDYVVDSSTEEGTYQIKAIGRTRPDSESGFYMKRSYSYTVDVTSPTMEDLSPPPGTFVPSTSVTLAVTAEDNVALDRIYVFEKKKLGTTTDGEEDYTWKLIKHQPIDLKSAEQFTSMNVGILLENVNEGQHKYRVVVKDRAGNVTSDQTSVYVTNEPDFKPPIVKPLSPVESGNGSLTSSYMTIESNPEVVARIKDSEIKGGVETQSGVYIGQGWPKVVYKVFESDTTAPAIEDVTIDYDDPTSDGFVVATSRVSFIKHNVNNVTMSLDINESLSEGDKVLIGVYARDKAGNVMDSPRKWYIEYTSSLDGTGPNIGELIVMQLGNHPNLTPPFIYTRDWTNPETSSMTVQDSKTFHVGWTAADQDGIRRWRLHYTEVVDLNADDSNVMPHSNSPKTKEFSTSVINDGESYGTELMDLDLSSPGVFYFCIEVTDYNPSSSPYYGKTTYYYLGDPDSDGNLEPVTHNDPPNNTSPDQNSGGSIKSKWIPVRVEDLNLLVFNMDNTSESSYVSEYYTDNAGPFYWDSTENHDSEDSSDKKINVSSQLTENLLKDYIDSNNNNVFDDYDMVLFFSGGSDPTPFTDGAIKFLHKYFASNYSTFRDQDNADFYPSGDKSQSSYFDAANPPRFVFVGKRFFHDYQSGTDMQKYFIERWLGLDSDDVSSYSGISDSPFSVSNLNYFWLTDALDNVTSLFDPLMGFSFGEVKKDSSGNELSRTSLSNFIKKLQITYDDSGFYDGLDNQTAPEPDLWEPITDRFNYKGVDYPANPGVHQDEFFSGPHDRYAYATKSSLVFGLDPDNINYTAARWMYPGNKVTEDTVTKWDFMINDYYDAERTKMKYYLERNEHTKLYHLGFNVEAVSTERDRYMILKRILKFMSY